MMRTIQQEDEIDDCWEKGEALKQKTVKTSIEGKEWHLSAVMASVVTGGGMLLLL